VIEIELGERKRVLDAHAGKPEADESTPARASRGDHRGAAHDRHDPTDRSNSPMPQRSGRWR
jgi:hypothetical protein